MSAPAVPALCIQGYDLAYHTRAGTGPALSGIDLSIAPAETLGLVGASGSGKSSLAWAILRMLPPNARENAGRIALAGQDLRALSGRALGRLRGRRVGMVFQDPSATLNPALPLGAQVTEALRRHRRLTRREAVEQAEGWLARTGLADPRAIMRRYPHQASGGEKQRVVIATAFACAPELIIFDEPTTALDVITGARILDLFEQLRAHTPVASLYISHDLALVGRIADRVAVLAHGRVVEQGAASAVLRTPATPEARRLLEAVPNPGHRLAGPAPSAAALLSVERVTVSYGSAGPIARRFGAPPPVVGARDITLALSPGEILGVVGESGSGKSTLARALTGLAPFSGEIVFDGQRLTGREPMSRTWRRHIQLVFQNPDASLNPQHRIGTILGRPLRLYRRAERRTIEAGVARMLEEVGLPAVYAARRPHQLSGGEKQRVAIARAFAAAPKLVICDEVTSSLDVLVQADIARLLVALQARHGTACLFITHDLNLVRQVAHRICVMHRGDLVDTFDAGQFAAAGRHPYTAALLAAVARL